MTFEINVFTCFWFGWMPGPPRVGLIPGLGCLSGHSLSMVLTGGWLPGPGICLPGTPPMPPILPLIEGLGWSGKILAPWTENEKFGFIASRKYLTSSCIIYSIMVAMLISKEHGWEYFRPEHSEASNNHSENENSLTVAEQSTVDCLFWLLRILENRFEINHYLDKLLINTFDFLDLAG